MDKRRQGKETGGEGTEDEGVTGKERRYGMGREGRK